MSLERFTRKQVVSGSRTETVRQIAKKMEDAHVGAVVLVDNRVPVGIVTDRDLALRILARGKSGDTPVGEVMSGDLVTVRASEALDDAILRMRQRGVRRLPIVTDDGALVGLVSLDDLNVLFAGEIWSATQAILENRGP
jgi:CBS domain-containing protein